MEKEQIREVRRNMAERTLTALHTVSVVGELFKKEGINDFIITGSQALIIGGFMTHRDGDDVDVRLRIPDNADEKERVWQKLQAWEALYEKEGDAEKYKETLTNQMFTFYCRGIKVNVFTVPTEEYREIPFFCEGYFYEMPASVLFDKMRLKRAKDYEDLQKIFSQFYL